MIDPLIPAKAGTQFFREARRPGSPAVADFNDPSPKALGLRFRGDERKVNGVRAGLLGRCPNCGKGPLFSGFLKVRPTCGVCGFDLASIETGDGAATFIMQIAGFLVGFSALYVEIAFSPPMWLHFLIWIPLVVALSLGLMRPGKGLMMALQMRNQRAGP